MKKKYVTILIVTLISSIISIKKVSALELDYIAGKDRYETANLIAQKMNYSSSVLVNGLSIVDGLSASGLSGVINAPILLTSKDNISKETLNLISKCDTVYLVGGTGVISPNIENKLLSMGKTVIRVGGQNRYETSILVAKQIEKIKGIQEIYYVNGLYGEADAMSVSPVAAKSGNPIILTDGKDTFFKRNVQSYAIGGEGVLNSNFNSFCQRISGSNRFETNKNVINTFFPTKTHVNLSKSDVLIDALTASALKDPVVLISEGSDKTSIAGAKSATVFGNISPKAVNEAKSYIYGEKVVFYTQHQDDETIFAGSAIVDAIASVGKENVFVVLLTDGSLSNVFTWERYKTLSDTQKSILRTNEFNASLKQLGVDLNNIIYLNEPESNINNDIIKSTMLDFENKYESITHITHSYLYDSHPQHLSTGSLLYELYTNDVIKDCRFFANVNYFNGIDEKYKIISLADNTIEKSTVLNACKEYKLDNKDMVREGIGYKSVSNLFNQLTTNPKATSYLHEPEVKKVAE